MIWRPLNWEFFEEFCQFVCQNFVAPKIILEIRSNEGTHRSVSFRVINTRRQPKRSHGIHKATAMSKERRKEGLEDMAIIVEC